MMYSHYMVVQHKHLNQYGSVFGGHLLSIIDEMAYITCERSYPGKNFVTKALDDVVFYVPGRLGDILETHAGIEQEGRTSLRVRVKVYICGGASGQRQLSFDGLVIMVCVDDEGRPSLFKPE